MPHWISETIMAITSYVPAMIVNLEVAKLSSHSHDVWPDLDCDCRLCNRDDAASIGHCAFYGKDIELVHS